MNSFRCLLFIYHRAYSLLLKLGIKSKNHSCTIEIISFFLPELKEILLKYKKLREDVRYYGQDLSMSKEIILKDVVHFFNKIDEFRENLTKSKIKEVREKLKEIVKL